MARIVTTKRHSHLPGRLTHTYDSKGKAVKARSFVIKKITDAAVFAIADSFGVRIDPEIVRQQIDLLYDKRGGFVGDNAFTAPQTTPSVPTPIQFLQAWLPGFVKVLTSARKIDEIIGVSIFGNWEDAEIVQGIVEPAATAAEYGDYTNVPLASWNTNFERRTIVRGELGIAVGLLEEGRAAAMRLASAEEKRQAAAIGLEILRNAIGFYGWNNGNNRTFGLLNDPALPAYITSTTASGWQSSTFAGIQADLRALIIQLRTQSQDQIDPEKVPMTLVLPMNKVDMLSLTTDFGVSVRDWLTQTYPKIRVVSCPEFQGAGPTGQATQDIAYLFAEEIDAAIDGSSDGGEVISQLVQTKYITLGVEKRVKTYVEDYANATAGVLCKRPWAVVRMVGI